LSSATTGMTWWCWTAESSSATLTFEAGTAVTAFSQTVEADSKAAFSSACCLLPATASMFVFSSVGPEC
jgi:hypothetical protein